MKKGFLVIGFLFLASAINAAPISQGKFWGGLQFGGPLDGSDFAYLLAPQSRTNLSTGQYDNTNIQAAVGYRLKPNFTFWFGLTSFIPGVSNFQNQMWQQISWNPVNQKSFFLSFRTRFEERSVQNEPQWSQRFRERVFMEFPALSIHKIHPVLWEEIFINLSNPPWVNPQTINQNRAFAGLRFPINKNASVVVGYLNQYLFRAAQDQVNHIIFLNFEIATS